MRKVTINIKRPNGEIEAVDVSKKFTSMNDILFANIKKSTAEAGEGECLSYKIEDIISEETMAEIKAHDDKARWFAKHGFNPNDVN